MSYDLFFACREPESRVTPDQFAAYFLGRRRYEVNGAQAWYQNEDTGVYFSFEYSDEEGREEDGEPVDPRLLPISFNLNFYRPHVFALEAEPEVQAFVAEFSLLVNDPQREGGDEDIQAYSSEEFLGNWNRGNEFGYRAMRSAGAASETIHTLPTSTLEAIWRWNYQREELQERLGQNDIFVPKFFFLDYLEGVRTAVSWPDGIPIALPEADFVIIGRKQFAPRRFLGRRPEDMILVEWTLLQDLLSGFASARGPIEYRVLRYNEPPAQIVQFITSRAPGMPKLLGIAPDQVLNAEVVQAAAEAG